MTQSEKRINKISVRVSEQEKKDLLALCDRGELATWIRETCLGQSKNKRPLKYPEIDPKLLRQLSGIGNNINQIARRLNSKDFNPVETVEIISTLQAIAENISIIKDQNRAES